MGGMQATLPHANACTVARAPYAFMQFLCTVHITRARARAHPILGMPFMPHSISYLRYLTLRPYDTYIARYYIGRACKRRHGVLCTPLLQVSTLITYLIAIIHTNMQHALATWPSWPHYSPESLPLRRPRHRFSVQEILHAKKQSCFLRAKQSPFLNSW